MNYLGQAVLPGCEAKLTLLQESVSVTLCKVNIFPVSLIYKVFHISLFVDT
jgi:hypothetical protein